MKRTMIILACLSFSLLSCVSKKKYTELEDSRTRLKNEVLNLRETKADYIDLQGKYERLEDEVQAGKQNLLDQSMRFTNLKNAHQNLQEEYDDLLEQNKKLNRISSEERENLSEELIRKQEKLQEKEADLRQLSLELKNQKGSLNNLQDSLYAREARIQALQSQLNRQQSELAAIRNQISNALLDFPAEDLSITQKNGKVYVSLSQNLLFATGSDRLDPKGVDAIKKLAEVLKNHEKIDIVVEGHTDDVGSVNRNWQLSTERALSVLKVLQDNQVNPDRLTASGRAFYAPVAPNDSDNNRALNRRTEIILSPDLSNLFKLVDEN